MDEPASQQLSALSRVNRLFEATGIAYWLFGGWAVDFYVGSVTRAHDDVDVAVRLDDLPRIAELLESDGWRHAPHEGEDGGTGYERGSVRLELTFLAGDAEGRVLIPFSHGAAVWSEEPFGDDVRELHGARAHLVGLSQLVRDKSAPRDDPEEAAKDRADLAELLRLGA